MKSRPTISIRFESQAQIKRFRRAAESRRWSLNVFFIAAAEALADQSLNESAQERIVSMVENDKAEDR